MKKTAWRTGFWGMLLLGAGGIAASQEQRPPQGGIVAPATGERIAWYATWEQGRAEAARTGRPILLLSAAPHCHGISGIW